MSRFTRAPFHKPSPFDLPRPVHPLSPPETDITTDSLNLPPMNVVSRDMASYAELAASSSFTRVDTPEHYQMPLPDIQTPGRQFRRPSNLSYLSSGPTRNDSRAPRSATRWLVMVIPPPVVSREHGNGVFLNGSARASQSVLLPLLPSLSGQLNAIAREFSFPSTSGICMYLQVAEGGIQLSPRISDESWSILWGSAFDDRQMMNTMNGLPIAGRIEFDLDLRKARWFDMWLSSCKKEVELGLSAPTSIAHRREESRTTFDNGEESMAEDVSVTIQRKVPIVRHIPRKLSLLDRVDVSALKPISRPASRAALSPTDAEQPRVVLSPVAQTPAAVEDEEPQTAIQRVEKKVQNWRASSSFEKSFAASTGQTALDPANMPNNQPLVESFGAADAEGQEPLNLDDFTWSISSAGPLSAEFDLQSPHFSNWHRPPSVHLDARAEGSVCLTPTTCTSFGPPDYNVFSPVASLISRLPSPDIAARQFSDAPPTPSTATSWGAPSVWPESPPPLSRAPSVDLGEREYGSRPATPSTATSWGAPLEWPGSPAPRYRAPSVDIGARHFESRPATPSTATSWGAPSEYPASPSSPFYVHTPGVGQMFFDDEDEESALLQPGRVLRSYGAGDEEPWRAPLDDDDDERSVNGSRPWNLVWPYRQSSASPEPAEMPKASTWDRVWPYQQVVDYVRPRSTRLESVYPSIDLYPAVYPYFDLYPSKPIASGTTREVDVKLSARYPIFSIYSAKYPSFEIYPGHVVEAQKNPHETLSVKLSASYPSFEIYSPVYPHLVIYPGDVIAGKRTGSGPPKPHGKGEATTSSTSPASSWRHVWPYQRVEDFSSPRNMRLQTLYPSIDLYPAVYPHFDLYPSKPLASGTTREVKIKLEARYPIFSIYEAKYPSFEIYPGHIVEAQVNPHEILSVKLSASYPSFEIYSPVYPNLVIYPGDMIVQKRSHVVQGRNIITSSPKTVKASSPQVEDFVGPRCSRLELGYPSINLYPAVYPYFDLYPSKPPASGTTREAIIKLPAVYPIFSIYAAKYPNFEIYPGHVVKAQKNPRELLSVKLSASYPSFEIYSPVYPTLVIYPGSVIEGKRNVIQKVRVTPSLRMNVSVVCEARYPNLDIYPAVYPYFDIYRAGRASTPEYWREARSVALTAKYPTFDIYPSVYPSFDIYRTGNASNPEPLTNRLSVKLVARYPAFDIYPAVYPNFELYPSVPSQTQKKLLSRRRQCKTHQDLVNTVLSQRKPVSSPAKRVRPRRTHKELVRLVFPQPAESQSRLRAPVSFADVPVDVGGQDKPINLQSSLPRRPSDIRRSVSLGQGTMSSSGSSSGETISRTRSLRRHLPSLPEESASTRAVGQRPSLLSDRKPSRRDSIVLEKARHWGAPGSALPPPPADSPHLTMNDLSEFPMPPLPPLPNNHSGQPVPSVNRPIAKLDRTKFPFR